MDQAQAEACGYGLRLRISKLPHLQVFWVYTTSISKQFALDLKKYNEQYSPITTKIFANSHDRFLVIDEQEIYHLGASLKDLSKKWFAFSKLELGAVEMLQKLRGSNVGSQ